MRKDIFTKLMVAIAIKLICFGVAFIFKILTMGLIIYLFVVSELFLFFVIYLFYKEINRLNDKIDTKKDDPLKTLKKMSDEEQKTIAYQSTQTPLTFISSL